MQKCATFSRSASERRKPEHAKYIRNECAFLPGVNSQWESQLLFGNARPGAVGGRAEKKWMKPEEGARGMRLISLFQPPKLRQLFLASFSFPISSPLSPRLSPSFSLLSSVAPRADTQTRNPQYFAAERKSKYLIAMES